MSGPSVDGVLVQWGERLFYPRNRIVKPMPPARLDALTRRKANVVRGRIAATVSRRATQVMVKVTGGGRGTGAIAAHFRYISKNGRLRMEDERGVVSTGKDAMHDLIDEWRYGGSFIDEVSPRREAFNIMLSMPNGTDPAILHKAARDAAESAQVRPASLARDLCREAEGMGHRGRGDAAGHAHREPPVGPAVAHQGQGGGPLTLGKRPGQVRLALAPKPCGCYRGLGPHRPRAWRI